MEVVNTLVEFSKFQGQPRRAHHSARHGSLSFSGGDEKEFKLRVIGRIWKEQKNQEFGRGVGKILIDVAYCITYILSCIAKHSPQYKILMLGRILGRITTSLFFSAFESWLVAENNTNGLFAILSGLFSNLLADNLGCVPVAPFDIVAYILALGMAIILSSWPENFGDPYDNKYLLTQFKESLFEGSMYTFMFLWTPSLSPNDEHIPHGFNFATFILSSMLESSIASRVMARASLRTESYMQMVFAIDMFTLLLHIITSILVPPSEVKGGSICFAGCIKLFGFCTFESCVGIFCPSIMKMMSQYIPEEDRSTIMNFVCVPLNIFVRIVLYNVNAFPITVMFGMCSIFMFMASILQRRLMVVSERSKNQVRSQDWTPMKERIKEEQPLKVTIYNSTSEEDNP
ncbi:hypothetical protein MKW92_002381 [Papaver armeniacum]|nr:hypothetical protein MKW92_002381 [Papaver armeniacum]